MGSRNAIGVENDVDSIRYVNYLVLNPSECSLLSGNSDPVAACRTLATKNKSMQVIITRGEKVVFLEKMTISDQCRL
ncbi:MAG: hypothetical protein M3Y53_07105 [Thermoproteota archaeon]|nr:hypothetical protein [Thermoproteota archaeon]